MPCTPARREGGGSGSAELAAALRVCVAGLFRRAPFSAEKCREVSRQSKFTLREGHLS